jgi:hypothetical protein
MGFGSTSFDGKHGGSKKRCNKKKLIGGGVGITPMKNSILIVPTEK